MSRPYRNRKAMLRHSPEYVRGPDPATAAELVAMRVQGPEALQSRHGSSPQQGRVALIVSGSSTETTPETLVTQWASPDGKERDIQVEISLSWKTNAQRPGSNQVEPAGFGVLGSRDAGISVGSRWRWSTGSMTRDTALDGFALTLNNGIADITYLPRFLVSARGQLISLRCCKFDLWLEGVRAIPVVNKTAVSVSVAECVATTAYTRPPIVDSGTILTTVDGGVFGKGVLRVGLFPPYTSEFRVRAPAAMNAYGLFLLGPDSAIVEQTTVSDYSNFKPIHPAAVAWGIAVNAGDAGQAQIAATYR